MKNVMQQIKIVVIGIIVAAGFSYAFAWTGPVANPPDGNIDAPINVGPSIQTKYGSLILNASSTEEYPTGLTVFGQSVFDGAIQIADGTQGAGKILMSDANGNASWATSTGSGPAGESCAAAQYVTGFDGAGNIICSYTQPIAALTINDDEQVYVHIKGTQVTLTNKTRNGASLSSATFANSTSGMPQDGKPLAVSHLVSNSGGAKIIGVCPALAQQMGDGICISQQPSAANSYETIIWIWDGDAGSHNWSFDLGYAQ